MQISINGKFVLLIGTALIALVSCYQRTASKSSVGSITVPDTLSIYPELPSAPLITPREADRSNPMHTGYIRGWEERRKNMYADTLQRTLKTLIMEDVLMASETAEPLRNDHYVYRAPVIVNAKWRNSNYKPDDYWLNHSIDSVATIMTFRPKLAMRFDCRFGMQDIKHILRASYPIEVRDTSAFKAVIKIVDPNDGKIYSPLFECFYRQKPFLICSFDLDLLKSTPGGAYMWNIIRNYTYSDYFRNGVPHYVKEMDYETWFDTLMPGFRLME